MLRFRGYSVFVLVFIALFGLCFALNPYANTTWFFVLNGIVILALIPQRFRHGTTVLISRIGLPLMIGFVCLVIYEHSREIPILLGFYRAKSIGIYEGYFFESITVLYAICTAFLLWKGLQDHDELKAVLNSEANEIRTIVDFCGYFDDPACEPVKEELRQNFVEYIDRLVGEDGRLHLNPANENILHDCIDCLKRLKARDEDDNIALAQMMRSMSELVMIRSTREISADKKIPGYLMIALVTMSLSLIFPFTFPDPEVFNRAHLYIYLLGTFFSFILLTLMDLSTPFDGFWKIKNEAFLSVRAHLRKAGGPR